MNSLQPASSFRRSGSTANQTKAMKQKKVSLNAQGRKNGPHLQVVNSKHMILTQRASHYKAKPSSQNLDVANLEGASTPDRSVPHIRFPIHTPEVNLTQGRETRVKEMAESRQSVELLHNS